jgi:hypothetical protein
VETAVAAKSDTPSDAPGSHKQFAELARVADEAERYLPDSMEMVRRLPGDHETLLETAREALDAAEEHHDQPSADLSANGCKSTRRPPRCSGPPSDSAVGSRQSSTINQGDLHDPAIGRSSPRFRCGDH